MLQGTTDELLGDELLRIARDPDLRQRSTSTFASIATSAGIVSTA